MSNVVDFKQFQQMRAAPVADQPEPDRYIDELYSFPDRTTGPEQNGYGFETDGSTEFFRAIGRASLRAWYWIGLGSEETTVYEDDNPRREVRTGAKVVLGTLIVSAVAIPVFNFISDLTTDEHNRDQYIDQLQDCYDNVDQAGAPANAGDECFPPIAQP